jgi:hypothetical protein
MGTVLAYETRTLQLLRPCWYRHPAVVQTLLDVSAAWRSAYRHADTEAPRLEWAQRHLPHLEDRMVRYLRQCTSIRHDPEPMAPPRLDPDQLRTYLTWWTGDRVPATEPR